jgi:hypothetical protein
VQVERDPDGTPVWHASYRDGNWAVLQQAQRLQPDTVYIYEADVKSTASIVSLYWQSDIGRFLDLKNTYADWTRLQYVFITPHWSGQSMQVGFNPVLMNGAGDVWLRGLRLSEFKPPSAQ